MLTMFVVPFVMAPIQLLITLAFFLIWIVCVIQAVNGKRFKLPVLGALAEKQAGV
jgi:uncharacterized membrane protein